MTAVGITNGAASKPDSARLFALKLILASFHGSISGQILYCQTLFCEATTRLTSFLVSGSNIGRAVLVNCPRRGVDLMDVGEPRQNIDPCDSRNRA